MSSPPSSAFSDFEYVCVLLVVIVGLVALVALLALFLAFLWRAWRVLRASWKPSPPGPRCVRCAHTLPPTPANCIVSDTETIFIFACPGCGHAVSVRAKSNEPTDTAG